MVWMPFGPNDPGQRFVDEWFRRQFPEHVLRGAASMVLGGEVRTPQQLLAKMAISFGRDLARFQAHQVTTLAEELFHVFTERGNR